MDMTILITGGAGYIGSHCNKLLKSRGVKTIILDDLSFGHTEAVLGSQLIIGDYGDKELLASIFEKEHISGVMHFGALADVADSVARPDVYYYNNVVKMKALLETMALYKVNKIIFSSSASVYGEPLYTPIDEEHRLSPVNPYGVSKLEGEKLLKEYDELYGIRYTALRYFNAAGADMEGELGESHEPEHHIIPLIFKAAASDEGPLLVYGNDYATKDGTCIRDFIHVMDLAEAHYQALEALLDGGSSAIYNLGSGTGFSILDLISSCERFIGKNVPYEFSGRRPGDPAVLLASNKKIKDELGWEPRLSSIENIITSAWQWEKHRAHILGYPNNI